MAEDIFATQNGNEELQALKQKIEDIENQLGAANPRNLGGIRAKDLRQATRINFFGDGSDGAVILDGTTTFSWASLAGSTYSLSRDLFATTITINKDITLNPNGFRIFHSADLTNNGHITSEGGAGGAGGNAVTSTIGAAGTAGTAAISTSGSVPSSLAGKAGGAGGNAGGGI